MTAISRAGDHPLMSDFVVHRGLVYLSGQVALDASEADFETQTRAVFARIDTLLKAAGTERGSLLTATIWLADLDDFSEFNALWLDWLGEFGRPARATVGAPLALPGLKVEVQVTAVLPDP